MLFFSTRIYVTLGVMKGTSRCLVLAVVAAGCGTGDTRVDPADLELRDLLGMSPEAASHWDADQRASARKLLLAGLHEEAPPVQLEIAGGTSVDARVAQTLANLDAQRIHDGGAALGMVRIALDTHVLTPALAPMASTAVGGAPVPQQEVWLAEQWDQQGLTHLAGRGLDLMSGLAIDAGHPNGPVVVVPVAHLAVIAGYVPAGASPARLVINPVMLAALEPNEVTAVGVDTLGAPAAGGTTATAAAIKTGRSLVTPQATPQPTKAIGGNPYSFYGSYEECAAAQSDRCQACLPNSSCKPVTDTTDGNAECTTLGANNGKGYYELCIDLALAISSVNNCVASAAGSCARSATAADNLSTLAANDDFLTDSSCSDALDTCLTDIYGAPHGSFPNPIVDGGVLPPSSDPPRDISPSCGKGCSNNTAVEPNCDCKGGNCGNSLTCSSGCAASNSQSGSCSDGSGCDSSDDDDSSGGGSCDDSSSSSSSNSGCGDGSNDSNTGSCSSDNSGSSCGGGSSSSSSGSSCDNSCGNSSSSSSSSSGCGSSGDSCGSSSSSSSGCGSSGGDSCGGSSSSSGCSSSSGGSGCSVSKKEPSAILAVAVSAAWGLMPVPIAAFVRRRARKKKKAAKSEEVAL